jgi:O-antigen ligase
LHRAARLARLRVVGAFLVGLTIPISTTISEIVTGAAFLVLLIEWQPRENWQRIRANPVVWASLGLYILLGLCMLYSVAPLPEAARVWLKYRELVYLPLFLLLCRDQPAARAGLFGFLSAMAAIFLLGVYHWLSYMHRPLSPFAYGGVFGSYITEGIMMALAAYYLAVAAILEPRWRKFSALAAGLALFYVLFVSIGRTGYVVALGLALLLVFRAASRKWRLPGVLLIVMAFGSVLLISPDLAQRMSGVVLGIEGSQNGAAANSAGANSAGARMRFYRGALVVIARHPIFGTGTGSFNRVYNDQAAVQNLALTTNPHNEYLMIGVQTGILGVAALLVLLGALWSHAARLPVGDAWRGRGVALALAISCLFNSSLLDHVDGQSFAFQIGLFYFGTRGREDQRHHHDL